MIRPFYKVDISVYSKSLMFLHKSVIQFEIFKNRYQTAEQWRRAKRRFFDVIIGTNSQGSAVLIKINGDKRISNYNLKLINEATQMSA